LPGIGDVIALGEAVQEAKEGNILQAAIDAAMTLLPINLKIKGGNRRPMRSKAPNKKVTAREIEEDYIENTVPSNFMENTYTSKVKPSTVQANYENAMHRRRDYT